MTRPADWYFDFISPFAYLQFKQLQRFDGVLTITARPLLFAGLLGHWQHKGPAEIPAKRTQTYRYCHWYAERLGVRFRTPPAHPFNPLKALRLAIALDAEHAAIATIFDYIWGEGRDVHGEAGFAALAERLEVKDVDAVISAPAVKDTLRANTERAIAAGVYGVPTFVLDNGELFWGCDLTDMLLDYLADPAVLDNDEMRRLATLPKAAERKR